MSEPVQDRRVDRVEVGIARYLDGSAACVLTGLGQHGAAVCSVVAYHFQGYPSGGQGAR
jgi:hypothetical protein